MHAKRSTVSPPILRATKPGPRRSTPAGWASSPEEPPRRGANPRAGARAWPPEAGARRLASVQTALALDKAGDGRDALAGLQIGEDERPLAAHALGVALHDGQGRPHMRGEVGLVNDQQIRAGDAGAALARDLFALRDIDHVD